MEIVLQWVWALHTHECYKKAIEQATGKRVVDISLDGTNPNWRRRIALKIIREIGPEWLIIHWGYIWHVINASTEH